MRTRGSGLCAPFDISLTVKHFRAISAGTCGYRQNITDTYPEGTAWQSQQFQVSSLSVGPNNQVHTVCEIVYSS